MSAFNAAHPDIKVVVRYVTTEYRPVIRNGFSTGQPPEIYDEEGYTDAFDYVQKGQLVDVTDWMKQAGNGDRFAKSTLPSVTYTDGKIYGVPELVQFTNSIWYNKKLLSASGIDVATLKTWPDFLAAFAKLKGAGVTPLAYGASDGWPGSEWYFSLLGKLAGGTHMMQLAAGNCGYKWTDPVSVQAAQMYTDLNKQGYFSPGAAGRDWNSSSAEFLAGKAAFYAMGSWFIPSILAVPNADDFGLLTFPDIPGGKGGQQTQLVAPQGFAITKSASDPVKKAAALSFISFVDNTENQTLLNKAAGEISAVTAANTPASLNRLSTQMVAQQFNSAVTQPYTFLEHATTIKTGEDAIWKGSVGALTGQLTAQSWMDSVQKADDATKGQNSFKVPPQCTS